jgi:hypothetical protein
MRKTQCTKELNGPEAVKSTGASLSTEAAQGRCAILAANGGLTEAIERATHTGLVIESLEVCPGGYCLNCRAKVPRQNFLL